MCMPFENGRTVRTGAVWRECHKLWAHLIRCHYDVDVFVLRRCNISQSNHRHHHRHHEQWQHVDFSIYPLCGIRLTKRLESATNNGNKFIETSPFFRLCAFHLNWAISFRYCVVAANFRYTRSIQAGDPYIQIKCTIVQHCGTSNNVSQKEKKWKTT